MAVWRTSTSIDTLIPPARPRSWHPATRLHFRATATLIPSLRPGAASASDRALEKGQRRKSTRNLSLPCHAGRGAGTAPEAHFTTGHGPDLINPGLLLYGVPRPGWPGFENRGPQSAASRILRVSRFAPATDRIARRPNRVLRLPWRGRRTTNKAMSGTFTILFRYLDNFRQRSFDLPIDIYMIPAHNKCPT